MAIQFKPYYGSFGDDDVHVGSLRSVFTKAGDDKIETTYNANYVFLAGGEDSDIYDIHTNGTVFIYDDGSRGSDRLDLDMSPSNVQTSIIEQRHLLLYDDMNDAHVVLVDWVSGKGVELYNLSGRLYSDAYFRENLTQFSGFKGYKYWDSPELNVTFTAPEMRAMIDDNINKASAQSHRYEKAESFLDGFETADHAVFRFYNASGQKHFYTASLEEAQFVARTLGDYQFEGAAFAAAHDAADAHDVFRFYNRDTGAHFYTISQQERDYIIENSPGFHYDGVAYQAYMNAGPDHEALYRFYDENSGTHFYTASQQERDTVLADHDSMRYEGVAFYVEALA